MACAEGASPTLRARGKAGWGPNLNKGMKAVIYSVGTHNKKHPCKAHR